MIESPKAHVIIVAYYFPPGQDIGGFRPFRFFKYLRRRGYPCHVITASRSADPLPEGVIWIPDTLGLMWEGKSKKKLTLRASIELLIRALAFPGHLGFFWTFDVAGRCRQIIRDHPGQKFVVFATYPAMGVLLTGLWLHWRAKIPWVCDFRDPMYRDATLQSMSRQMRFCNYWLERSVFRTAAGVIANTSLAADVLSARYPWARSKLNVIWNGFDPEEQPCAQELPARKEKAIVHAGGLHSGRSPNLIIESLSRLRQQGAPEVFSASLILIGDVNRTAGMNYALSGEAERAGWLKLLPTVPKSEALRLIQQADGLLLLQPQSDVQVPGKLFEYICIGRPILALVPKHSAVEQILVKAGVPYVCIYSDDEPGTIDQKLLEFLRLPTQAVRYSDWFRNNFNAEYQAEQLASIIEQIR